MVSCCWRVKGYPLQVIPINHPSRRIRKKEHTWQPITARNIVYVAQHVQFSVKYLLEIYRILVDLGSFNVIQTGVIKQEVSRRAVLFKVRIMRDFL